MSLGIFSFDLAALINSLSDLVEADLEELPPAPEAPSLERAENVLEHIAAADSLIGDALMAAALESAVTKVLAPDEKPRAAAPPAPKQPVRPAPLDEATKKEIERLIRALQTSVIHNYRGSDIADESVARARVANFPRRRAAETDENPERVRDDRRREEARLRALRDELRRARLKNDRGV